MVVGNLGVCAPPVQPVWWVTGGTTCFWQSLHGQGGGGAACHWQGVGDCTTSVGGKLHATSTAHVAGVGGYPHRVQPSGCTLALPAAPSHAKVRQSRLNLLRWHLCNA